MIVNQLFKNPLVFYRNKPTRQDNNFNINYRQSCKADCFVRTQCVKTPTFQANLLPTSVLATVARRHKPKINALFMDILSDIPGIVYSRIKSGISINDKIKSKGYVDDLIGYTKVLEQPDEQSISEILRRIKMKHDLGQIRVTEIKNYYDPECVPYIGLQKMIELRGFYPNIPIENCDHNNGYTTAIVRFLVQDIPVELQLRGKHVEKIQRCEHLVYDISQNKTVLKYDELTNSKIKAIMQAYKALTSEQRSEYNKYISKYYRCYRALEDGYSLELPELPKGIDSCLSIPNLKELELQQECEIVERDVCAYK